MTNIIFSFIIILILFLLFGHNLAPESRQWFWGWLGAEASLSVAFIWLATFISKQSPKLATIVSVIAFHQAISAICSAFYINVAEHTLVYITAVIITAVWILKQALLLAPPSEPLKPGTYFYGLAAPKGAIGILNAINPLTTIAYGGRLIIANDHVYLVHKKKFKKIPLQSLDSKALSEFKLVDSMIEINEVDSKRLDSLVGKRFIPLMRDCSCLRVQNSVTILVLKKMFFPNMLR